jgi:type I restriction enzyme, R subunit
LADLGDIAVYGQESNYTTWTLARMNLAIRSIDANLSPKIDLNFEEIAQDTEEATKKSLCRKWAQLEAMVGTDKRTALVAQIGETLGSALRRMKGKAMVVRMSRRISRVALQRHQKLRPDWGRR